MMVGYISAAKMNPREKEMEMAIFPARMRHITIAG